MLCNCQALVMGGRYRCCSKVEGCSSADDFDYYQSTPSVKFVNYDKGICGVQVLDVNLAFFHCMDEIEKKVVFC